MIKTENIIKKLDNIKKILHNAAAKNVDKGSDALDNIADVLVLGMRDFMYMDDGDFNDYTPLQHKFYDLCNSYSIMWLSPNAGWRNVGDVDVFNTPIGNSLICYLINDLEDYAENN